MTSWCHVLSWFQLSNIKLDHQVLRVWQLHTDGVWNSWYKHIETGIQFVFLSNFSFILFLLSHLKSWILLTGFFVQTFVSKQALWVVFITTTSLLFPPELKPWSEQQSSVSGWFLKAFPPISSPHLSSLCVVLSAIANISPSLRRDSIHPRAKKKKRRELHL